MRGYPIHTVIFFYGLEGKVKLTIKYETII